MSPMARFLSLFLLCLQGCQIYSNDGFSPGGKVFADCLQGDVLPLPSSERANESMSLLQMSNPKSCIFPVTLGRPLPSSYTLAITVAKEMLRPADGFRPGSLSIPAAITVAKGVKMLLTGLGQSVSSSLPSPRAGGWGAIPPQTQGFATRKTGVPQRKIWGLSARGKQGEGVGCWRSKGHVSSPGPDLLGRERLEGGAGKQQPVELHPEP